MLDELMRNLLLIEKLRVLVWIIFAAYMLLSTINDSIIFRSYSLNEDDACEAKDGKSLKMFSIIDGKAIPICLKKQ